MENAWRSLPKGVKACMRFALLVALAICGNGCCVGFATKVRNHTGREISITVIHPGQIPSTPVPIPAGASGICDGVIAGESWIVSDGQSRFCYNELSPIGAMRGPSRTESRFTSLFPCNRITQHVAIESNMAIYAVSSSGRKIPQPAGFPIYCTKTNTTQETGLPKELQTGQLQWARLASVVSSNQMTDLTTLREQLLAEKIPCSEFTNVSEVVSFAIKPKQFKKAHAAAVKIIERNLLTVYLAADANGFGYEIWVDGKITATMHF